MTNALGHRSGRYDFNKLEKRLLRDVGRAVVDYSMIDEGDRIMVCLSGGADSFTMLEMLRSLQARAPVAFSLVAVNMDQKQPGFPEDVLPEFLRGLALEFHVIEKDTYSIVQEKLAPGKTACGLCSRLRRGTLYEFAERIDATKIALGHHLDDIVETLFLNLFFGARLSAMPPKLLADDARNIVIRPLAYCREREIKRYAEYKAFPIIPCNLCGTQENLQRQAIKSMLADWDKSSPGRVANVFAALCNVAPSQLADRSLFDFDGLTTDRAVPRAIREHTKWAFERQNQRCAAEK